MNELIEVISWDDWGNLKVSINGKVYNYKNVYKPLYEVIERLLRHKNYSKVFKILKGKAQNGTE